MAVTFKGSVRGKVVVLEDDATLPEGTRVTTFLDDLRHRLGHDASQPTPYKPVALGGLWAGVTITDEDIAEVRRQMWEKLGEEKAYE